MEQTPGSGSPQGNEPGSGVSGGWAMAKATEEGGNITSTTTHTSTEVLTTGGGLTAGEAVAASDDADKMEEESQADLMPVGSTTGPPATGVMVTGGSKGIIPQGSELRKLVHFLSPGGGRIRAVKGLATDSSEERGGGVAGGGGGVDVDGREAEVTNNLDLETASPGSIFAALDLTPDTGSLTLGVDDQHGQRNHLSMPSLSPSPSPSCYEWTPPQQQQPGTGPIPGGSDAMVMGNEKDEEGASTSRSASAASAQEEEQGQDFQEGRMTVTTPAQLTSADGIEVGKGEGQPENLAVGAAPNIPTPVNSSQGGLPTEEQGGGSQEVVTGLVNDFVREYKQKRNSAVVTSPWSFPPKIPPLGLNSAVALGTPKQIPVSIVLLQNHPRIAGTGRGGKKNLALTRAQRKSANDAPTKTTTVANFPQSSSSPKLGTEQGSKPKAKVSLNTSMEVQKKSRAPRKSSQKQITPAPNFDMGLEMVPWTADRNELDAGAGELTSTRNCVVCLRKTPFIDEIFKGNPEESMEQEGGVAVAGPISRSSALKARVLPHIRELIEDLNVHIPFGGTSTELGICFTCLDLAQRRHILSLAIANRREEARSGSPPPGSLDNNAPFTLEPFEGKAYPNYDEIKKLRELLSSSTHRHFARRHLTDVDWNFICQNLTGSASPTSKTALSLKEYIESGEKLSQLHCLKCKTMVEGGKDGYVGHMKLHHHKEPILFPCDICGEELRERSYFPHWISHFYAEECEECGRKFAVQRNLRLHRRVHKKVVQVAVPVQSNPATVRGGKGLALALVGQKTPQKQKKGSVETNMANLKAPTWECLKCRTSFSNAAELESHARSVHSRQSRVCSYCGKVLTGMVSHQDHVARHEGRRDHKCEVCNKEYVTKGELREHSLVHQTAKNSICGDCGKAFKTKRALKEHESLHSGLTPFACPVCDKKFRLKGYLNAHMKNHQDDGQGLKLAIAGGQKLEVKTGDNPPPTTASIVQLQPNPMMPSSSSSVGTAPLALPHYSMDSASQVSQPLPPSSSSSSRITKPRKGNGKSKEDKKKHVPVPELQQINQESGPSQPTPLPLVPLVPPSPSGTRLVHASIPQLSASTSSAPSMAVSAYPSTGQVGGAAHPSQSAVNIVLQDCVIGSNGERGPMVVRVDGLSGGPNSILQMAPEQQSELFSRIQQLAFPQMGSLTLTQSSLFGGVSVAPADPTYVGGQLLLPPTTAAAAYNGGMNWEGTGTLASSSLRDMDWNWERNVTAPATATVTSASGQDDVGDGVGLAAGTATNNSNQFYQFPPPPPPPLM